MKLFESVYSAALKLFSVLFLVLLPVRPTMIAVGSLILADLVTGIWASAKEGNKITSAGLKVTINKMAMYEISIIMGFVLETWLVPGIPFVKVFAAVIGMAEGKSLFENMRRITGVDLWSQVMKKIQEATKVVPEEKDQSQ